jgi:hypothetical protein
MSATDIRDPFAVSDADLAAGRALAPEADEGTAFPLETWLGRGLLVIALLAALICDLRLVHDIKNYAPDNEANRVAVIQHIADHGTPPTLGKDFYIVEPSGTVPPHTTVLRQMSPGDSTSVSVDTRYPQAYGLERPYAYYLAVPVSWIVPWSHRILVLRLLCVLLACAGIAFLWKTVREAWPANPLAAGVSAIVLATMSGLVEGFAAFQPIAGLFALWCAGMWLALRDFKQRSASGWLVGVWAAATCLSSAAVLPALVVVGTLSLRAGARGRAVAARLAIVLASTVVWAIWNLHAYGDVWPLNTPLTGPPDRPRDWRGLTTWLDTVYNISASIFDELYASGVLPVRHLDTRPETLIPVLFVLAVASALWSGRIASARLPLARLGVLMLGSFVLIYVSLVLASVVAASPMDYSESTYGGYAAAWAGVAGVGLTAPLVGHRRTTLVAVTLLTLVLVGIMLRAPAL